jgi:ATP-binding cassette subfamily C protein CydD
MTLLPGLFVLVLAPEVFLPVRNVGAAFHASSEGMTASADAFDLLAAAGRSRRVAGSPGKPALAERRPLDAPDGLVLDGIRVRRGDRVVIDGLRLEAEPGEVVALTGESGSGKSSLIAALLGFADVEGEIRLGGRPLASGDRSAIAWAGQSPTLLAGTIASNVRLGEDDADPVLLARALHVAGVELDPEQRVGPGGTGLSGGQAQRVATARAVHRLLARNARLLMLDEPTSAQDPVREADLAARLRELAAEGRIVLVATHRSALVDVADRSYDLEVAHA